MSHELRTPLNGIIGMVDLVLMGEVDKDKVENLKFALQSAHQLNNIVNDIMELAQIDSRVSIDHSAPFSLTHMLSQVFEEYEFIAYEKNITLQKKIVGQLPEVVIGDQPKIRRIFSILIGNAIKFTHEGEVSVSVCFDFDRSVVNLDVIDTGVGISKEHQGMIFEPFVQADSTMTRRFGGVGLGLTICSRLVNLLGGEISLKIELGKGTSFNLRVPVSCFNSIS
jgi:signal transduction histidine kinase